MKIAFRDFYPEVVKYGFLANEHESLPTLLEHVNTWLAENSAQVINVETLLLPDLRNAEDSQKTNLKDCGSNGTRWLQVVRVWYQVPLN